MHALSFLMAALLSGCGGVVVVDEAPTTTSSGVGEAPGKGGSGGATTMPPSTSTWTTGSGGGDAGTSGTNGACAQGALPLLHETFAAPDGPWPAGWIAEGSGEAWIAGGRGFLSAPALEGERAAHQLAAGDIDVRARFAFDPDQPQSFVLQIGEGEPPLVVTMARWFDDEGIAHLAGDVSAGSEAEQILGTGHSFAPAPLGMTEPVWLRARVRHAGPDTTVDVHAWPASEAEPATWETVVLHTANTTGGLSVGVHTYDPSPMGSALRVEEIMVCPDEA